MRCGLIGEHLGHSFSPELHGRLGRYSYELIELPPEKLEGFLKAGGFDGLNVTIPYKQAVIPLLDGVSRRAAEIGAVNTVVRRGGKLWGYNTDLGGLTALLGRLEVPFTGKTVLIAGTGGTSRTAMAAAKALGAGRVLRLSRSGREDAVTYEEALRDFSGAEILINTTPAGMYPDLDSSPLSLDGLPQLEGVADAVYNPLRTRLALEARARGIPAVGGLYMLVAQAALSAELFTGERVGTEKIERVYRGLLAEKRNVVLIGMPGSGKSAQGRLLARRLGLPLFDSDAEIEKRAGSPVPELLRRRGEAYFRELETETLRELSRTGGKILSTGGGAVLRRENADALRQNGILIWLDRPLEDLRPTADRPLSDSAEKLRELYRKRGPVYRDAADRRVPVFGTPEETLERILEALK